MQQPSFMRWYHAQKRFSKIGLNLVAILFVLALYILRDPAVVINQIRQLTNSASQAQATIRGQTIIPPSGFRKTIFDDEFNGTSLDTTKWNIESQDLGGNRSCCSLHQSTYFTPQDVTVRNGSLVLETERRNYYGYNYTTGMVQTQNLFAFQYGRIDIRAKLPGTQGIWPGFWMLPPDAAKPNFEIDIMELLGKTPHTVYMTNHWGSNQELCSYTGPDFTAGYHVFSVEWQPGSITWFIDSVPRCYITEGVSDTKMFILLDTWIGRRWGLPPDNMTIFPAYNFIDYVRVYQ